ncbi:MAG: alpha/beta fold hydrolase [Butyrivibrio sp.]|nr:alpha/beta fold hydrolase [Butyrivibrio sp.]
MILTDDGINLHTRLDIPHSHNGKCPLVIVIHGFTGHMEERHITTTAETFNDLGYATLRVDMYGHGRSGGQFRNHTLFKWMTNAMTVIDYARTLDFVTELYLCGHSQGGLTVMLAAALKQDVIRGIIPMSPAVTIPEDARRGNVLGLEFDPDHIPEEVSFPNGFVLSGNHIRVSQMIRVEDAIDRYTGPVLLIHGEMDETIPVQASVDAAERYQNAQLVIIPGETHCYDCHLDEVQAAIRQWMPKV